MSTDLSRHNGITHTDSQGRGLVERLADAGYHSSDMRENILAGTQWGTEAFSKWRNSPGHNANFLCPVSTEIGIARVFSQKSKYHWYWTCIFGSNSANSVPLPTPTPQVKEIPALQGEDIKVANSPAAANQNEILDVQSSKPQEFAVSPWFDVFDDFEQGWKNWDLTGNAWEKTPTSYQTYTQVVHIHGDYYASTLSPGHGYAAKGRATSKSFTITRSYIHFLIGGGNRPDECYFQLLVDGQVQRSATGNNSPCLTHGCWDVRDLIGKTAELVIGDCARDAPRGYIMVDNIVFSDSSATPKAIPKGMSMIATTEQGEVPSADGLVMSTPEHSNQASTKQMTLKAGQGVKSACNSGSM